jgi:hypothetical protein
MPDIPAKSDSVLQPPQLRYLPTVQSTILCSTLFSRMSRCVPWNRDSLPLRSKTSRKPYAVIHIVNIYRKVFFIRHTKLVFTHASVCLSDASSLWSFCHLFLRSVDSIFDPAYTIKRWRNTSCGR